MKKFLFCFYSFIFLFSLILPVHAAEYPLSGPNIEIEIDSIQDTIYVTLLCETAAPLNDRTHYMSHSNNPYDFKYDHHDFYDSLLDKMGNYAKNDRYYFVDNLIQVTKEYYKVYWYGKTSSFKIMVYLPESDSIIISDEIETNSSYLNKYHVSFNGEINVEPVNPYPTLLPLCFTAFIGSVLIRFMLSYFFKYQQSNRFSLFVIKTFAVSLLYSFILAVMTYYNGKIAFIIIEFICFWILLIIEYLFSKFLLSIQTYHFLYSLLCNILHYLFCFSLFNNYIW